MIVRFREKAMIAFESMNRNDQAKVRRAVEILKNDDLKPLKLNRKVLLSDKFSTVLKRLWCQ